MRRVHKSFSFSFCIIVIHFSRCIGISPRPYPSAARATKFWQWMPWVTLRWHRHGMANNGAIFPDATAFPGTMKSIISSRDFAPFRERAENFMIILCFSFSVCRLALRASSVIHHSDVIGHMRHIHYYRCIAGARLAVRIRNPLSFGIASALFTRNTMHFPRLLCIEETDMPANAFARLCAECRCNGQLHFTRSAPIASLELSFFGYFPRIASSRPPRLGYKGSVQFGPATE